MEIWASIDLMEGKVVRLVRGDPASMIVYSNDPTRVAMQLESLGFDGLHVVDLDAAMTRGRDNMDVIRAVLKAISGIRVQVGGGIRNREKAVRVLELGVDRIVVSTLLFKDPKLLASMIEDLGGEKFVVALDHYNGRIVYDGWRTSSKVSLVEGYQLVKDAGASYVLVTSVDRDGTLSGPDLDVLKGLSPEDRMITYVSGGITTPKQVTRLKELGVRGAVLGRVIYEGIFSPSEFIRVCRRGASL